MMNFVNSHEDLRLLFEVLYVFAHRLDNLNRREDLLVELDNLLLILEAILVWFDPSFDEPDIEETRDANRSER